MTQLITRTFTLDRKAAEGDTFPVTLTTEQPVLRSFGYEVIDMDRLDLSRSPLPLLEGHDASKVNIGIVEGLRADGTRLRGTIRMGKTARARELVEDIKAGIVTSVSVGYQASDPVESGERDGYPIYRFKAAIMELSLVSVPADITAGINRNFQGKITMETQDFNTTRDFEESKRISAIEALGQKYDLPELTMRSIAAGTSVKDFNAEALKAIDERNAAARTRSQDDFAGARFAGMPADSSKYGRAMGQYSVVRILRGLGDPRQLAESGLEMEISQQMQRDLGKRSKGVLVPFEALQQRAVTYGGTGSSVVATDHMAGSFIDVLRNRSVVMTLNPTILRGLQGNVDIPRKTSGATGYWIAGDNADSITDSDLALDQVSLSPKVLGGAVVFSHRMIIQSSPDIESMVRQDLADLIATEIDAAAINGSGASNEPLGILGATGVDSDTYTNGTDPTWLNYVAMESAIAAANADAARMAYLLTPALVGAAKTTSRQASGVEGNFILQNGKINDIVVMRSANVPAGYAILGDWSSLILGFWGGIELDADPYGSNFLKGSITVRAMADVDVGVRHGESFAEIHEAGA